MFALILLTNFVAGIAVTIYATVTIKASIKHNMEASSPYRRSVLTNQFHDCLFYLTSVMKMCRKE